METLVKTEDDGTTRTFVGLTICEGPETRRLILTRPYHEAGHIVEIPNSRIESIEPVSDTTLGNEIIDQNRPTR
jgi:hypothetical protein